MSLTRPDRQLRIATSAPAGGGDSEAVLIQLHDPVRRAWHIGIARRKRLEEVHQSRDVETPLHWIDPRLEAREIVSTVGKERRDDDAVGLRHAHRLSVQHHRAGHYPVALTARCARRLAGIPAI